MKSLPYYDWIVDLMEEWVRMAEHDAGERQASLPERLAAQILAVEDDRLAVKDG